MLPALAAAQTTPTGLQTHLSLHRLQPPAVDLAEPAADADLWASSLRRSACSTPAAPTVVA